MKHEIEDGVSVEPWHSVVVDSELTWRLSHPADCAPGPMGYSVLGYEPPDTAGTDDGRQQPVKVRTFRCQTQYRITTDDTDTVPRRPGTYRVRAWWVARQDIQYPGGLDCEESTT